MFNRQQILDIREALKVAGSKARAASYNANTVDKTEELKALANTRFELVRKCTDIIDSLPFD